MSRPCASVTPQQPDPPTPEGVRWNQVASSGIVFERLLENVVGFAAPLLPPPPEARTFKQRWGAVARLPASAHHQPGRMVPPPPGCGLPGQCGRGPQWPTVPVYIAEMAPPKRRGTLQALFQVLPTASLLSRHLPFFARPASCGISTPELKGHHPQIPGGTGPARPCPSCPPPILKF